MKLNVYIDKPGERILKKCQDILEANNITRLPHLCKGGAANLLTNEEHRIVLNRASLHGEYYFFEIFITSLGWVRSALFTIED